jgi:hypothetical protein
LDGTSAALQTVSATERTGDKRASSRGGHRSRTAGLHVGHGSRDWPTRLGARAIPAPLVTHRPTRSSPVPPGGEPGGDAGAVRRPERSDWSRAPRRTSRLYTTIGRGAALVWPHPRRREEAAKKPSGRERGRHPTDASQVGSNPRLAAGSTVVFDRLYLFCCAYAQGERS